MSKPVKVLEGPSGIAFALMITNLSLYGKAEVKLIIESESGQPSEKELTLRGADVIDTDKSTCKFGVVDSVFETLVLNPNTGQGNLV